MKFNKSLDLNITIPTISIRIMPDESLRIGGNVRRRCSDLGLESGTVVDTFTYKWVNENNNIVSNTNTLDIPIREDTSATGTYECQHISQETGKVYKAKTIVNLKEDKKNASKYQIQIIPTPEEEKMFKPISLFCNVTPFDNFKYQWFKDNIEISTNQTISFNSFAKRNEGIYKCQATLFSTNGDVVLVAEKPLSLRPRLIGEQGGRSPKKPINVPIISFNVTNVTIVKSEMQYLSVSCNVTNLDPSTFTSRWINSNGELVSNDKFLYFKSLVKSQEGKYFCEILIEKMKFNKSLDLNITIPTISIRILPDESLRIGGNVRRRCSDLGLESGTVVDTFTYKWVNEKNNIVSNTDTLDIPIRDKSADGTYECQHTSQTTGKVYKATTNINIQEEKKGVTTFKIDIAVKPIKPKIDEAFSMHCLATPPDGFTYQWLKNNKQISTNQTLFIQSFTKNHEGIYKCVGTAKKESGDITLDAEAIIKVQQSSIDETKKTTYAIQVKVEPTKPKFAKPFSIRCEVTPSAGFQYQWFKDNKEISSEQTLSYENFNQDHVGNYKCKATAKLASGDLTLDAESIVQFQSRTADEEFTFGGAAEEEEADPVIQFNIEKDSVNKSEMQYLSVNCNVTNMEPNTYAVRWINPTGETTSPDKILFFKSLLKSQEGNYRCEIEKGKKKFNKILGLKITIPKINIKILQDESLQIGGRIRRKCSDLGLDPATVVDTFSYKWVNEKNQTVSTSDLLDIPITDASIGGTYECQYVSKSTAKVYKALTFAAIQARKIDEVNYKILITTRPESFKLGEPFSLSCDVSPVNGFTYKWYKNDVQISSNQTIIIPTFQKDNVGTYKCRATIRKSTGDMSLEADSTLQYNFLTKSEITLTEKPGNNIFVHPGEKKEFHCEIESESGKRGSDVIWYFNGKEIVPGFKANANRIDRGLVSLLVVRDITLADEGQYECLVANSRKEVNITVIVEPGFIETSPPLLRVKVGGDVEFHCRVENFPGVKNVNLKWQFQSKDGSVTFDIPDARWTIVNHELTEQTSFVELSPATMPDNGYLICSEPGGQTAKSELIVIPSDESIITITPKEVWVRSGQKFDIECYTTGREGRASGKPKFMFSNEKAIGRDSRFAVSDVGQSRIRLTAPNGLQLSDNNMTVHCGSGDKKVSSRIFVKDPCPTGYRSCQNGQCLVNAKFCDGNKDCDDGSDENQITCKACDPISKKCEMHLGVNAKKPYYLIHWACDGEDDCKNGFDEVTCGDGYLESCGGRMYTCADGKKIPRSYVCDQNIDCTGAEDENACTFPQITNTSVTDVKGIRDKTVTMTCKASGKPLPRIIWRFNWGCIPQYDRISIKSVSEGCTTVTSTITINQFQPGDDGIYNCEALSNQQRAFSNDFQVVIYDK